MEPGGTVQRSLRGPAPNPETGSLFSCRRRWTPSHWALLVGVVAAQGEPCWFLGRIRSWAACSDRQLGAWTAGSSATQPYVWPHLQPGPSPRGQGDGQGEPWGRRHSMSCLEGTGGEAWLLRAHSRVPGRGASSSSVGDGSGGG